MSEKQAAKNLLWQSHIDSYQASGLTAKEWCSRNDVSYAALNYWIKKRNTDPAPSDTPVFACVTADHTFSLSAGAPLTIRFASATIEVSDCCHPQLLESLIQLLKKYA